MKIQGHRVEVKSSTLWENGFYKFQQIRDQDYAFLICLGLSPHSAQCWIIPKKVLYDHVIDHTPQHGGKKHGKKGKDTYWFTVYPDKPENWLEPYGGTLANASRVLMRLIG